MSSHSDIYIVMNQSCSFDGEMNRHLVLGTMLHGLYDIVHPIQDDGMLSTILCLVYGCILGGSRKK